MKTIKNKNESQCRLIIRLLNPLDVNAIEDITSKLLKAEQSTPAESEKEVFFLNPDVAGSTWNHCQFKGSKNRKGAFLQVGALLDKKAFDEEYTDRLQVQWYLLETVNGEESILACDQATRDILDNVLKEVGLIP